MNCLNFLFVHFGFFGFFIGDNVFILFYCLLLLFVFVIVVLVFDGRYGACV